MKEKLIRFMYGRYGMDSFGKFLIGAGLVSAMLSNLFHLSSLFYLIAWIFLIYAYFRMFSRQIYKRSAENQAYLKRTAAFRLRWQKQMNLLRQHKTHHIYKCPSCHQKIRVPRGKGKIEIRCPKCQRTFIKKS